MGYYSLSVTDLLFLDDPKTPEEWGPDPDRPDRNSMGTHATITGFEAEEDGVDGRMSLLEHVKSLAVPPVQGVPIKDPWKEHRVIRYHSHLFGSRNGLGGHFL